MANHRHILLIKDMDVGSFRHLHPVDHRVNRLETYKSHIQVRTPAKDAYRGGVGGERGILDRAPDNLIFRHVRDKPTAPG